jgi:HEAT repeat protein
MGRKKIVLIIIFAFFSITSLKINHVLAQGGTPQTPQLTETPTQAPPITATLVSSPIPTSTPEVSYTDLVEHFEKVTTWSLTTSSIVTTLLGILGVIAAWFGIKTFRDVQTIRDNANESVQETKDAVKKAQDQIDKIEDERQAFKDESNQQFKDLEDRAIQLTEQFENELRQLSKDIKISQDTTRWLQHLQEARDSNPRVRLRALQQLANISDTGVVSIMIERLTSDEDSDVRAEAAFSLGRMLCEGSWDGKVITEAEEALLQGIDDENESIRDEVLQALKKLACGDVSLSRAVYRRVRQIADDNTNSERVIQIVQNILECLGE